MDTAAVTRGPGGPSHASGGEGQPAGAWNHGPQEVQGQPGGRHLGEDAGPGPSSLQVLCTLVLREAQTGEQEKVLEPLTESAFPAGTQLPPKIAQGAPRRGHVGVATPAA